MEFGVANAVDPKVAKIIYLLNDKSVNQ